MTSPVRSPSPGWTTALYLAVGVVWAFRSVQSFSDPSFTDPQSVNDWVAVLATTLGAVLLGLALMCLPAKGPARWLLRFAGAASVVVGLANLGEDAFGSDAAGTAYFVSTTAFVFGLVLSTVVLLLHSPRWPAVVTGLTWAGLMQLENGGGLLLLPVWGYAVWASRR